MGLLSRSRRRENLDAVDFGVLIWAAFRGSDMDRDLPCASGKMPAKPHTMALFKPPVDARMSKRVSIGLSFIVTSSTR